MTREEIISQLKKFFDIDELVCNHVYAKYGDKAWQYLQTDFLHALLIIRRDIIAKPMYANGSSHHQRGFRCNLCDMVKSKKTLYISAHMQGMAGDFTISGMTAEQARTLIKSKKSLLPCNIRMEKGVSWLHIDTRENYNQTDKVYEFTA